MPDFVQQGEAGDDSGFRYRKGAAFGRMIIQGVPRRIIVDDRSENRFGRGKGRRRKGLGVDLRGQGRERTPQKGRRSQPCHTPHPARLMHGAEGEKLTNDETAHETT